jgi:hypothetical protein
MVAFVHVCESTIIGSSMPTQRGSVVDVERLSFGALRPLRQYHA